jgi:isopenicillin-N N-acyltransferase like protein
MPHNYAPPRLFRNERGHSVPEERTTLPMKDAIHASIPILQVVGSHREVGRQIGQACREQLRLSVERAKAHVPSGLSWEDLCQAATPYLAATRYHLPWIMEELEGASAGAGIDLADLGPLAVEEIWDDPQPAQRCSDFAVGPPIAADGGMWLAHNNDLSAAAGERLIAIEWQVDDQPPLFTIGVAGLFISVGYNAAGLSLTGNELSPNDNRIGIPRLLLVRDILAQRTAQAAIQAALHPKRASSYNNLIAHRDGTIINVEGSATDYALLPAQDGWTVHTNHYVSPSMLRYEADPAAIRGSAIRFQRACELIQQAERPITPAMLQQFLADREHAPDCLCKIDGNTRTVFWCIIGLHQGHISYGRDPRSADQQEYIFPV